MTSVAKIGLFLDGYKPEIKKPILTWTRKRVNQELRNKYHLKDGESLNYFYNMNEGKASHVLENVLSSDDHGANNYVLINKTKKEIKRYFIDYAPELDGFVICQMVLDVSSFASCQMILDTDAFDISKYPLYIKVYWEQTGIMFIGNDKSAVYKDRELVWDGYEWQLLEADDYTFHKKLDKFAPFSLCSIPKTLAGINNESWEELLKPLLEIFPKFCNIGGNKIIDISASSKNFLAFLRYDEPKVKLTKTQKMINHLISLPLKGIDYSDDYDDKMAFIERIESENPLCVIRTMVKDNINKTMVDGARIYVSKKEVIACRPDNNGNFVQMMLKINAVNWNFSLFEFDESVVYGTKLEYFGSIVNKVSKNVQAKLLWSLLTYPFIEQLCKVGFEDDVFEIIKQTDYSKIIIPFNGLFGNIDSTKKSLTGALGINKYQLKRLLMVMHDKENFPNGETNTYMYWGDCFFSPLISIKRVLDVNHGININYYSNKGDYGIGDISYLDNESFDILLNMAQKVHRACIGLVNGHPYYDCTRKNRFMVALSLINRLYGFSTLKAMIEPLLSVLVNNSQLSLVSFYGSHLNAFDVYLDYLDMVYQLNDTAHFRAKFDPNNVETISAMHDLILDVFNCKQHEIEAAKFDEMVKKWDKWTFSDDIYSVIAPSTPDDVAYEGIELHHCVGSYIKRIVNDITNILFIRKNESLDVPFFTVEITNDSVIQQIHGFGNRNSDTEPGLDGFIKKWVVAKKLKTSNFDKVR